VDAIFEDTMFGASRASTRIMQISAAYFTFDTIDLARKFEGGAHYAFLIHHVLGATVVSCANAWIVASSI
jgi:hypothetical protein